MCGRVRLSSDYSEIKIRLKFAPNSVAPNFESDWNKPPTAPMLVAIRSVNGERVPKMMKWGLVPHWAKDDKLQFSTFNARAEEFTTKPAFRDAWKRDQRWGASQPVSHGRSGRVDAVARRQTPGVQSHGRGMMQLSQRGE